MSTEDPATKQDLMEMERRFETPLLELLSDLKVLTKELSHYVQKHEKSEKVQQAQGKEIREIKEVSLAEHDKRISLLEQKQKGLISILERLAYPIIIAALISYMAIKS